MRRKHLIWTTMTLTIGLAFALAWSLELNLAPSLRNTQFAWALAGIIAIKLLVFWLFGLPTISWRQVGLFDLCRIGAACAVASALSVLATAAGAFAFPPALHILDGVLCLLFTAGAFIIVRVYEEVIRPNSTPARAKKSILIYGAGLAGAQLAKEIRMHPSWGVTAVGFLDDDEKMQGSTVLGLPVLGRGRDAASVATRFARRTRPLTEIVIAIPMATGAEMRTAVANCRSAGVAVRTLPSITELLDGKVIRQIRDVAPEDLLGREPVRIEEGRISEAVTNKSILVTGGCGSIGSEICRQVARFQPRKLVVLDQAESEAFMLAMNLRKWNPSLDLSIEIGDIAFPQRIDEVVRKHSTEVVFHAAAYKHVPLMEEHVVEAVTNNVVGSYNVALAAHRYGVERFVLISTDKAVNPTSVMGLTKRAAELLVSAMPLDEGPPRTRFMSVRFGNVLGSSGSAVPIFRQQIAAGGPVTITHPEMRRYFMSISEAVLLVLQASVMGEGSEVFVLDMGEPVLIADLARNMIRLAGLMPDEDIEIRFTGLRPGEKLFEEIHLQDENHLPTEHAKIARFSSRSLSRGYLSSWMAELHLLLRGRDRSALLRHLRLIVPEYTGNSEVVNQTEGTGIAARVPVG